MIKVRSDAALQPAVMADDHAVIHQGPPSTHLFQPHTGKPWTAVDQVTVEAAFAPSKGPPKRPSVFSLDWLTSMRLALTWLLTR